ncbi:M12 family metallopeptidase [Yinghuangia soli]|uniref:M12 family metallopeptidase n=1 Tax=Yinghuangia soli TaxID=2908204 RepID=A0AA41PWT7_9ACTN|nr:M12 family metallopeptidase [Yinghuangia soli]MCF2527178.1 M12 family metallopeptidase [Yinghuangia soli]
MSALRLLAAALSAAIVATAGAGTASAASGGESRSETRLQEHENQLFPQFDYTSIMMYGSYAFSGNGQPTMVPRGTEGADAAEARGLQAIVNYSRAATL